MTVAPAPEPIDPDLAPADPAQPAPESDRGSRPVRPAGFWRQRARPGILVSVGLGGALGTATRDWVSTSVHITPGTFPWATFWINVTGSFVLGVGLTLILERFPPSRYVRPFFATGICGGYTTFSTYMVDTDLLFRARQPVIGVVYLATSVGVGLAAALLGAVWGRLLPLELAPLFGHRVQPRRRMGSRA